MLAEHFLARFEQRYRLKTLGFTDQALAAMHIHTWPGNIRELQNTIERGVILTGNRQSITEQALFTQSPTPARGQLLGESGHIVQDEPNAAMPAAGLDRLCESILTRGIALDALEDALIERAYRESDGNVSAAARRLGLSRPALDYRLKKRGKS